MAYLPLPIDTLLSEILSVFSAGQNLILQASPGSGKTTRVPPALLQIIPEGKEIWVLVPRRLAAKTAAMRVAQEMGEEVGDRIGYHFRFEKKRSAKTRILFLTEGLFIRLLMNDPELSRVQIVILDEFHERHLHTDVSLALVRHLQKTKRPDLKILVMSATLDTQKLESYLGAMVLSLDSPRYPVSLEYVPQEQALLKGKGQNVFEKSIVQAISQVLHKGDVLVFLPGMAEIRRVESLLLERVKDAVVLPLHGDLPREEQDLIFKTLSKRKIILSTNIAESSLTIPGISVVVDSGLHRQASHDHWSGVPTLKTRSISQASALQRMGRAGRTGPGHCIRVYSQSDFEGRIPFEKPEIARSELSQTLLEIKSISPESLEWFEAPPSAAVNAAHELLYRLGATTDKGEKSSLTPLGHEMAHHSLHPRLSKLLLEIPENLKSHAIRLVALISEDELSEFNILDELEKKITSLSVKKLEEKLGLVSGLSPLSQKQKEILAKALLKSFPDHVVKRRKEEVVFCTGGSAMLPETSEVFEYAVVIDVWERQQKTVVHSLAPISSEWLLDLENDLLKESKNIFWDSERKMVVGTEAILYGDLVLNQSPCDVDTQTQESLFIKEGLGLSGPITINDFLEKIQKHVPESDVGDLIARLEILRKYKKINFEWSEDLIKNLIHALIKDCSRLSELLKKNLSEEILYFLSQEYPDLRQKLIQLTPTFVTLNAQRKAKIHYTSDQDPWIESKLQDFFGMQEGPKILGGQLPLTLHLLAPNRRPVQVTRDLASFWKNTYPQVRKELSRKYPRHPWPEIKTFS